MHRLAFIDLHSLNTGQRKGTVKFMCPSKTDSEARCLFCRFVRQVEVKEHSSEDALRALKSQDCTWIKNFNPPDNAGRKTFVLVALCEASPSHCLGCTGNPLKVRGCRVTAMTSDALAIGVSNVIGTTSDLSVVNAGITKTIGVAPKITRGLRIRTQT